MTDLINDFDKIPGVIDELLIYNAIISQGPKGEEGKIFKEQGINYNEIKTLRLEFFDILKIDHLWSMTNLTKLQLCNNIIEVIENLDTLINLRELDLSFNNISNIKNLDKLVNLEIFTLYENKITTLENMDELTKLRIFSVGNNRLADKNSILYLRRFQNLRSLNLSGNPLCRNEHFYMFVYAYLPQIVYYEYRMVQKEQRDEARIFFGNALTVLEEEEAREMEAKTVELEDLKQEERNKEAFVEYLGGSQLFNAMFDDDPDGKTILLMGDEIIDTHKEFMKNFVTVTKEIHEFGLHQHELRKKEIHEYETSVKDAKKNIFENSRKLLEDFLVQKREMFGKMKVILNTDDEDSAKMELLSAKLQEINETFQELCLQTWHTLMRKQLYLFEAIEKVNETLERSLTQQVNELIETAQAKFTQLRTLEAAYDEATVEIANRYMTRLTLMLSTNKDAASTVTPQLLAMMADKEALTNGTSSSHDRHLQVIDQREDLLLSSVRSWLTNFIHNITKKEINRNRQQIEEINHFLDSQKQELAAMTSSPMGLQMLPSEIQEALQIN